MRQLVLLAAAVMLAPGGAAASELRNLEDLLPALDRLSSDLRGTVGIAVVALPRYSGSDETKIRVLPLVNAAYKDTLYFQIKRAGAWLYSNPEQGVRIGIALEPRGGRDENDGPLLVGTADRGTSWEAGLVGEWQFNGMGVLELAYFTDVSGNNEGDAVSLQLAMPLYKNGRASLLGAAKVEWLSDNIADFLYGVTEAEVLPTRPRYTAGSLINLSAGLHGQYRLSQHWQLYTGAKLIYLGDDAADSPVVADRVQKTAYLGVGWGF